MRLLCSSSLLRRVSRAHLTDQVFEDFRWQKRMIWALNWQIRVALTYMPVPLWWCLVKRHAPSTGKILDTVAMDFPLIHKIQLCPHHHDRYCTLWAKKENHQPITMMTGSQGLLAPLLWYDKFAFEDDLLLSDSLLEWDYQLMRLASIRDEWTNLNTRTKPFPA